MASNSNDIVLDDDYVAGLLAEEAADCSLKYSSMGLDAYNKPAKRPAHHPTPNTRFLRNVVRGVDVHNQNLLSQERAESQARLRDLEEVEAKKRHAERERHRRQRPGPQDMRSRMLGNIHSILGGASKKRKVDDDDNGNGKRAESTENLEPHRSKRSREEQDEKGKDKERAAHSHDSREKGRSKNRDLFADHDAKQSYLREDEERGSGRSEHRRSRHRSDKAEDRRIGGHSGERGHERHHYSPRRDSESERSSRKQRDRDRDRDRDHDQSTLQAQDSDSDPLEDIIGPKPPSPVRRRGRGATSGASGIDNRFATDYDPTNDVSLDHNEEDDDWSTSLEALRARQQWKQQGADRLRAAGFTEDEVKKWESGGQRNEEDVRWTKKGEQREWDRGKTSKTKSDGSEV
ncbi:hypothetical protein BX600DRAFT_116035 [Xylariales sp. PMI_506]|nr:hypothetical protein BX600DRAFT_116035 [Xylariales sp. PMI_506]